MAIMNYIHPGEVAFFVRGIKREENARKDHVRLADHAA